MTYRGSRKTGDCCDDAFGASRLLGSVKKWKVHKLVEKHPGRAGGNRIVEASADSKASYEDNWHLGSRHAGGTWRAGQ